MIRSIGGCALMFALLASGQQDGGPPPELRSHIGALVRALNSGSSGEWEKMAQEHFSPAGLKRHSANARKQVFDTIRRDFGTVSLGQVEGPEEPLQLHIQGSTGASGVIELKLEPNAPYRIDYIGAKIGGAHDTPQPGVDPPPVTGKMPNDELGCRVHRSRIFHAAWARSFRNTPPK